jgi:predicted small metal-binding protein
MSGGLASETPEGRNQMERTMPTQTRQMEFCCGDLLPGCGFTARATTEEELFKQVKAHAAQKHGITEVTPELAAKVREAIQTR